MTLHNLSLLKKHELNAVLYHNPLDEFPDIEGQSHALNLYDEQQKDHDIKTVIRWKTGLEVPNVKYAPQLLRKYYKHLNRLVIENVLYREFYDDTGRVQIKQYCLPKHLWKEIIYRLHNSPTAGHLGIQRTLQEFRKRLYYPGVTQHLCHLLKTA